MSLPFVYLIVNNYHILFIFDQIIVAIIRYSAKYFKSLFGTAVTMFKAELLQMDYITFGSCAVAIAGLKPLLFYFNTMPASLITEQRKIIFTKSCFM